MNNCDRRVQKLEDQKRAGSGICVIVLKDGETVEEAKMRIGLDPDSRRTLIAMTPADAAVL